MRQHVAELVGVGADDVLDEGEEGVVDEEFGTDVPVEEIDMVAIGLAINNSVEGFQSKRNQKKKKKGEKKSGTKRLLNRSKKSVASFGTCAPFFIVKSDTCDV